MLVSESFLQRMCIESVCLVMCDLPPSKVVRSVCNHLKKYRVVAEIPCKAANYYFFE